MTLTGILLVFLRTGAVALAGIVVNSILSRSSASARHFVWAVTLISIFIVALGQRVSPWHLSIVPVPESVERVASPPQAVEPEVEVTIQPPTLSVAPDRATPISWMTLILIVWATGSAALLALLGWAALSVTRIVRRSQRTESKEWLAVLYEAADRLDVSRLPILFASNEVSVPFAAGILRPCIVLPTSCESWPQEQKRDVLLHELAHIRRHDLLTQRAAHVICAICWFQPLTWIAARGLRNESELACDDLVVDSGSAPVSYANHLLELVTAAKALPAPAAAISLVRPNQFEGRMLAILDAARSRSEVSPVQGVKLGVTFAAVVIAASGVTPVDRSHASGLLADSTAKAVALPSGDVLRLLRDPDPRVRESAAATIGYKSASGATRDLINVVERDDVPAVRRMAAWALAQAGNDVAVRALSNVVNRDADADVAEMAAWGIGWSDHVDGANAQVLERAVLNSPSDKVRETSAWALARSDGDAAAITTLSAAIARDSRAAVRETSAWALGFLRRGGGDALTAALKDSDKEVRLTAQWALARVKGDTTPRGSTDEIINRVMTNQRPLGADPWPRPRPRPLPWSQSNSR